MSAPLLSFELFPPSSSNEESYFWQTIHHLHPLTSAFLSLTNSPRDFKHEKTYSWIKKLHEQGIGPLAVHMTCVGMTRTTLDHLAQAYWSLGVRHIVVIKGEALKDTLPLPTDFHHTKDLIKTLKSIADFKIIVGCFPEPRKNDIDNDLDHLAVKVEAGADYAISQFCFHVPHIVAYRDQLLKRNLPIKFIPGIMPLFDVEKIRVMARAIGATFPEWLDKMMEQTADQNSLAAAITVAQCHELQHHGFDQFHIYTMNQLQLPDTIARFLSFYPA